LWVGTNAVKPSSKAAFMDALATCVNFDFLDTSSVRHKVDFGLEPSSEPEVKCLIRQKP